MRYYSTQCASVKTVRKVGFYPSERVAKTLATQLQFVLGLNDFQTDVATALLSHGSYPGREEFGEFTPAELKVITNLRDWWAVESIELFREKAFVMVDLNEGKCVVVVASDTMVLDELKFVGNSRRVKWAKASEMDVKALESESKIEAQASAFETSEEKLKKLNDTIDFLSSME